MMIRFLADENFNNQIVRGILSQNSQIDIVRVQDVGLSGVDDPNVLGAALLSEKLCYLTRWRWRRGVTPSLE